MSFDGFFLHHMVEELRSELVNGRIQKINQPFEQELVLQIRSNRQSHRLLLVSTSGNSGINPPSVKTRSRHEPTST